MNTKLSGNCKDCKKLIVKIFTNQDHPAEPLRCDKCWTWITDVKKEIF